MDSETPPSHRMNRTDALSQLRTTVEYDILVVGGGATGLGIAVDAAARGHRVCLIEQADFAKGTSSRSTKLVHGGVRYLKQGHVPLVLEALRERGLLCRNAPHLVHHLPFVIPSYHWWESPFYGIGLKVYDALAGRLGLEPSRMLSREETLERIPTIEQEHLTGGVLYHDGQFDDARLAITLAHTASTLGATLLNHTRCESLLKRDGQVCGVVARDAETGESFDLAARVVINATGVFVDELRRQDEPGVPGIVAPSQGVHLVLPAEFLPGDAAIMIPRTDDGRVLFAVPWHGRVVVGTTDTAVPQTSLEPRALPEEVRFLMSHAARYLTRDPSPEDVLSIYAGLRPLVRRSGEGSTASLSRDHTLLVSQSGLLTITGGKWTTYRHMAEDATNHAETLGGLDPRPCRTRELLLHGATEGPTNGPLAVYGSDAHHIESLISQQPGLGELLHSGLPYCAAEVLWHVRQEMARTVEDVLARRTRALLLDARASSEAAPRVAALMAQELGHSATWEQEQVTAYQALAKGYWLPGDSGQSP